MNRRGFFKLFGIGVAGIALEQAIPLGRVWSFPKEIVIPDTPLDLYYYADPPRFRIGDTIRIRMPQRWYIRDADWLKKHPIIYPPDEILTVTEVFEPARRTACFDN